MGTLTLICALLLLASVILFLRLKKQKKEWEKSLEKERETGLNNVGILSHDIRLFISPIESSAALLLKEAILSQEGRELLILISSSSKKLKKRMDEIVRFVERGKNAEVETFNILSTVEEIFFSFREEATAKNLTVKVRNSDVSVTAQRDLFKVVMENLISNAVKYSQKGGYVIIVSDVSGREATIIVSNSVSPGSVSDSFRNDEKLGLGLMLSKDCAHKMGGTLEKMISGDTEVGFAFIFPLK